MTLKHVARGTPLQPEMRATTWNAFIDAANERSFRSKQRFEPFPGEQYLSDVLKINCLSKEQSVAIQSGDVVKVVDSMFDATTITNWKNRNAELKCSLVQAGDAYGSFGVAYDSIAAGSVGLVSVRGIVPVDLWVDTDAAWMTRADIDVSDSSRLKATPNGAATIVWKADGENTTVKAYVALNDATHVEYIGVAKGDILPDATDGVVTIWENGVTTNWDLTGVHLDWMAGDEQVSNGKEVLVAWFPNEQIWRIVGAECEDKEPPIGWGGNYDPAAGRSYAGGLAVPGPPWPQHTMIEDAGWLMVSNKETSARPAPIPTDTPLWGLSDTPGFATQSTTPFVEVSNRYTMAVPGYIEGIRAYVPTNTADYEVKLYLYSVDDSGSERLLHQLVIPDSVPTGWVEIAIERVVALTGDRFEVAMSVLNSAGETVQLEAPWAYIGTSQGADPIAGDWNTNNQNTLLRINTTDDNAADQSAALASVVPGDVLTAQGSDSGNVRRYSIVSNDGAALGVNDFTVVQTTSTGELVLGEICTLRVARQGANCDYSRADNYWGLNGPPSWASSAEGWYSGTEGGTQSFSTNAYGPDLLLNELTVSPDWDFAARSSL